LRSILPSQQFLQPLSKIKGNGRLGYVLWSIVYSTYYGGTGIDEITGMKLDAAGNVVVIRVTDSPDFRAAVGKM